ncbi:toxin Cry1Ac domain D-VI-related protein [Listeria rustica]|uniref:Bacterial Ig domain-containing protein n=1 Tax=Listeria rustica TaxID=2713503 RepID=A0A7W1YGU6_9LIST|nr:toxin Cry1Ac domain D-VI-related protein [Listeria rustica]MBA3927165.1 hypothetical protein [Listeria rustica]
MNKNIKKVAAVILATNVLASTVITTLPIGTQAETVAPTSITEVREAVAGLFNKVSFTGTSYEYLKESTTQAMIDEARTKLNNCSDITTTEKNSLNNRINRVEQQFAVSMNFTWDKNFDVTKDYITHMYNLPSNNLLPANFYLRSRLYFFDANHKFIGLMDTPSLISDGVSAPFRANILPDAKDVKYIQYSYSVYSGTFNCQLSNFTKEISVDATNAVDSLFTDGDSSKGIREDLSQADIDKAQTVINTITDATQKADLQAELDKAQNELNEKDGTGISEKNAEASVDSLFINGDTSKGIKADLSQTDIDAAKAKVDALPDSAKKTDLQADINKAQTELNAGNPLTQATDSVNALFADAPTNSKLKNDTTQAMIDAAKVKVDALSRTLPERADLNADLQKAQDFFNVIAPTTIAALSTDSIKVTGTGEPNAPVTIKNGTATIGSGTVKADGTFEISIAKQAANATITATVTKASNNKTATASTKVTQNIDYSLTTNAFKMGDTTLTGTVGKDVSKVRLWINGAVAVQGVVKADGTYSFPTAGSFIKLIGDKVEVVAVDSKYAEVNRKTVTVTGTSTFDNALTVNKFNTGDTKIAGTFGKDIAKIRLWVNDKVVTQATTNANGTFEFANADRFITSPLDKVEVVAVDSQYKELNRKTVSLPGSDSYDNTFSVDNYFIGQNTLGGSYGQGTSKVRLWVNGVVVKQADLNAADKTYTLKGIFGLIKSKTDVAEVVYVDAQYKEIKRVAVTIK